MSEAKPMLRDSTLPWAAGTCLVGAQPRAVPVTSGSVHVGLRGAKAEPIIGRMTPVCAISGRSRGSASSRSSSVRRLVIAWMCTFVLALVGCKGGAGPEIAPIADQVAVVGQQLTIDVYASHPDGKGITFSFEAAALPDRDATTSMNIAPDGHAVFRFTPRASQIGTQFVDFIASDGKNRDQLTILIEVKSAAGSGTLPIFRKPLGSGTVLDLQRADCVEVPVEIEDSDSSTIDLTVVPPLIADSELSATSDGLSGTWSWCPNRQQIQAGDRYDLTLSADDGDNPPALKDYVVVLRKRRGDDCPGEAPVIEHTATSFSTQLDLEIRARVSDDKGLKHPPILLYSTESPGNPIDFSKMTLLDMELVEGNMQSGTWAAWVPNPTVNEVGSTSSLYYIISATDDDDEEGDCDHLTDHPAEGTHKVDVTNDGQGSAGVCAHCSADVQCGDEGDLCLPLASGQSRCGTACSADSECPETHICSPSPVASIGGASGRQCIPNSGSCGGSAGTCVDDDAEPDDNPTQAAELGALPPSTPIDAVLCPDNEDWYMVQLSARSRIDATLDGDFPPDMDLQLTNAAGEVITQSLGLDSSENLVSNCLDAATYFLRVFSVSTTEFGDYTIAFTADQAACASNMGTGDCCSANGTPGCSTASVQTCVCDVDAFCCERQWDAMCASVAQSACGACGGGPDQDCCTAQDTPGCTDSAIEACVCAQDAWCCSNKWDSVCVGKVGSTLCAPACNPGNTKGPCCEDNGTPGCEISGVETCVCNEDPFCCSDEWDDVCVGLIATHGCGTCPS